jgi:hypothetical protein
MLKWKDPHHVHSEPIRSSLQPPVHKVSHRISHLVIAPVEIRLLGKVEMKKVGFSPVIPCPGGPCPISFSRLEMGVGATKTHPPKQAIQLLGGFLFPSESSLAGRQMYQSRFGSDLDDLEAWNQACYVLVPSDELIEVDEGKDQAS